MTTHPINSILVDGVNVSKGAFRLYDGRLLVTSDVNDIRATDLAGCVAAIYLATDNTARLYGYDASDISTTDDGDRCIKDYVGRRFKLRPTVAADLTAAVINTALGTGGLNPNALPGNAARMLMLRGDDGNWNAQALSILIGYFDDYFGSSSWRTAQDISGNHGLVTALPQAANKRVATLGYQSRAVLFADGSVGVAGGAIAADGSGTNTYRYSKLAFSDGVNRTITKIWVGGYAAGACLYALDNSGVLWSWGYNANGQLGLGDTTNRAVLTRVDYFVTNSLTVSDIAVRPDGFGAFFTCSNGQLYYVGENASGVAGDGTTTGPKTSPVRCGTLTSVTAVFPGCSGIGGTTGQVGALAGGVFYVWGYNANYELGLGNTTLQSSPVNTGLSNVTKATMGIASIALKSDGTAWSAGSNAHGGPCQGTFTGSQQTWAQIASLSNTVLDIASTSGALASAAAIVTVAGTGRYLRTWGYNVVGQLGIGSTTNQNTVQSPSGAWQGSVNEVGAFGQSGLSAAQQIIIRVGNLMYGAGYNANSNLSIGSATNPVTTFAPVLGIRGAIQDWAVFGADTASGLVVRTDAGTFSGGYNAQGQAGVHEGNLHNVPILQEVLVGGLIQGPTGATGPVGPAGSTGLTGSTGAAGPQGAGYGGISITSLTVGTGSKTLTTQAGLAYLVGSRIRVSDAAGTANWMEGVVTYYNAAGTTLTLSVDSTSGSGTIANWNLSIAGQVGPNGPGTGDMLKSQNLSGLADYATARTNLGLGAAAAVAFASLALTATLSVAGVAAFTNTAAATAYNSAGATFAGGIGVAGSIIANGTDMRLGAAAGATAYFKVDAALANQAGYAWRSAGVDKWLLYRVDATENLAIYNATVGQIVLFTQTTGRTTFSLTTAASSSSNAPVLFLGGVGVAKSSYFGSASVSGVTVGITSQDTAWLVMTPAAGNQAILHTPVAATLNITTSGTSRMLIDPNGVISLSNTTASTGIGIGALNLSGGLSAAAQSYFGDNVFVAKTYAGVLGLFISNVSTGAGAAAAFGLTGATVSGGNSINFYLYYSSGSPYGLLQTGPDVTAFYVDCNTQVWRSQIGTEAMRLNSGRLTLSNPTGGLGYGTGAGGTVTQATSKSTGVTLNKVCGQITMNNAALAAGASVSFTVTNSAVAATDLVAVAIASGATPNSYTVTVSAVAAGSFNIMVHNVSGGSLSEAIVISFAIVKAVNA